MKTFTILCSSLLIALGFEIALTGYAQSRRPSVAVKSSVQTARYSPTSMCKTCHDQIVAQHLKSEHEKAFTNPTFQAQYRKDLQPKVATDQNLLEEARECISCHEPITYVTRGPQVISPAETNPGMNGVTCDICHTIKGYRGSRPQNGNWISEPSDQKFGPFQEQSDWHHTYSEYQTKSDICAVCHEAVNRHGLKIKATFTEWQESAFAQQGVQCQDCHMNVDGFLTAGKPRFTSGKAAAMSLGSAPQRDRLYTHEFPGAHSKTQVEGAIELAIEAKPGDAPQSRTMTVEVTVDNSRTGHSMPSGSADLRLLWLEVNARVGDRLVTLPVASSETEIADSQNSYSLAGYGKFDSQLLGPEVPRGSRVYRAIFGDARGQVTLNSYDAVGKLFDNRLKAAEKRREVYRLTIPVEITGDLAIEATLKYLPYSSAFTDSLGLPKPDAVIVAKRTIQLNTKDR